MERSSGITRETSRAEVRTAGPAGDIAGHAVAVDVHEVALVASALAVGLERSVWLAGGAHVDADVAAGETRGVAGLTQAASDHDRRRLGAGTSVQSVEGSSGLTTQTGVARSVCAGPTTRVTRLANSIRIHVEFRAASAGRGRYVSD